MNHPNHPIGAPQKIGPAVFTATIQTHLHINPVNTCKQA